MRRQNGKQPAREGPSHRGRCQIACFCTLSDRAAIICTGGLVPPPVVAFHAPKGHRSVARGESPWDKGRQEELAPEGRRKA